MGAVSPGLRRHLGWAVPLVAAPVLYFAGMFGSSWLFQEVADQRLGAGWSFLAFALVLVGVVAPVVALVRSAVRGHRAFRHWRRGRGHYTKAEATQGQREHASSQAWAHARALQVRLSRREVPQAINIWDVVANPGEVFFLDVPADYARHYGMDVTYSQTSAFYFGRPAFVLAGLGATALSNSARRNAAAQQGAAQWRERQPCRLVVSNQRLMCQVGGRWLSFHFSAVTAVYPEVSEWSLITQYDSTSPLLLSGVHVPAAALFTVLATHGVEAVSAHPSLRALSGVQVAGTA